MQTRRALAGIEKKFAGLTIEHVAQDGSFSGYASLFGEVDLGKDAIEPGAFLKSVHERGAAGIAPKAGAVLNLSNSLEMHVGGQGVKAERSNIAIYIMSCRPKKP